MFDLFVRSFRNWRRPRETAEQLLRLSDAQLRDIGVRREEIWLVARGLRDRLQ